MGWQKNSLIYHFYTSDYNHFFIETSEKNHLFSCPGVSLPAGCEARSKLDSNQAWQLNSRLSAALPTRPSDSPSVGFYCRTGICFTMGWLLPDVGQLWGLQPRLAFSVFYRNCIWNWKTHKVLFQEWLSGQTVWSLHIPMRISIDHSGKGHTLNLTAVCFIQLCHPMRPGIFCLTRLYCNLPHLPVVQKSVMRWPSKYL